jgi:hypothetical protein
MIWGETCSSSHGGMRNAYRIPMSENMNERGQLGVERKIILKLHLNKCRVDWDLNSRDGVHL